MRTIWKARRVGRSEPVFIGPVCVGKTSVSAIVASRLQIPRVELDEIAMDYYRACPEFDPPTYNHLMETAGFVAAYRYWEPALVYAVERVVADHPNVVLDLGAGHTCLLDRGLHARVEAALSAFDNIVLLLPDPDPATSVRVVRERLAGERDQSDWKYPDFDFPEFWVNDDQNHRLAARTIYTGPQSPSEVADEVAELLR